MKYAKIVAETLNGKLKAIKIVTDDDVEYHLKIARDATLHCDAYFSTLECNVFVDHVIEVAE